MDYSNILSVMKEGGRAFNSGLKKGECPIETRTHSNHVQWWKQGWQAESDKTCKGLNCNAKRGVGHSEDCIEEHKRLATLTGYI